MKKKKVTATFCAKHPSGRSGKRWLSPFSRKADARGFTLIEVLLATALSVTLLLGLWTLFGIYTNLFTVGQTKTETSQLARALLEQLADDLHSAIQDPIPGAPAKDRTSTPLRRFVLSGSSDQLRLDVLQVTPLQGNPTPVGDSERLADEPSAARVPELRTVYYTFQDPLAATGASESTEPDAQNLPGLVRRELDFETPPDTEPGSSPSGALGGLEAAGGGFSGGELAGESGASDSSGAEVVDTSITWVPEVVRLKFRYFDGSGWTGQWNSLSRKALPVAVEVIMQLGTVAQSSETIGEPEPGGVEEAADLGEELAVGGEPELVGPTYRLVIDVPGSPKHGAPRKVQPVTVRPAPRPVPRRAPPRPRPAPPSRPTARPLADEWMRTQS